MLSGLWPLKSLKFSCFGKDFLNCKVTIQITDENWVHSCNEGFIHTISQEGSPFEGLLCTSVSLPEDWFPSSITQHSVAPRPSHVNMTFCISEAFAPKHKPSFCSSLGLECSSLTSTCLNLPYPAVWRQVWVPWGFLSWPADLTFCLCYNCLFARLPFLPRRGCVRAEPGSAHHSISRH